MSGRFPDKLYRVQIRNLLSPQAVHTISERQAEGWREVGGEVEEYVPASELETAQESADQEFSMRRAAEVEAEKLEGEVESLREALGRALEDMEAAVKNHAKLQADLEAPGVGEVERREAMYFKGAGNATLAAATKLRAALKQAQETLDPNSKSSPSDSKSWSSETLEENGQ